MTPVSYLFVPGDSARKQEKALASGAHAMILDLEDSVAPSQKQAARERVAAFLSAPAPMRRLVRVNDLSTGLTEADVAATAPAGPDGYVLPKCEGPADVERLARMIEAEGVAEVGILAIATETVRAVRNLLRADWSHPRLTGLTWGGEDLSADMGAFRNKGADGAYLGPFLLARDAMLFAALEAGVPAIDAVFTDFRDEAGLEAEARAARTLGFSGKMAIHPAQVGPIHRAFRPNDEELEWARAVESAFGESGTSVASLGGRMIDLPHLKQARKIIALATSPDVDGA